MLTPWLCYFLRYFAYMPLPHSVTRLPLLILRYFRFFIMSSPIQIFSDAALITLLIPLIMILIDAAIDAIAAFFMLAFSYFHCLVRPLITPH